ACLTFLALALITGCDGSNEDEVTPTSTPTSASETPAGPVSEPQPAADGPCPYLDQTVVELANGQRVSSVQVSADEPYPACFFLRADGSVQLRTWVVRASPEVAIA